VGFGGRARLIVKKVAHFLDCGLHVAQNDAIAFG
jgi:hypothetical protein